MIRDLYAAAHVAGDGRGGIDWEATLRYRHHLWDHGLGVAEAMDTAQRGMGLGWGQARQLCARTLADGRSRGARVVCGVATDQLEDDGRHDLAEIAGAYEEQCATIEGAGGAVVLMASRELARAAASPEDYLDVYGRVLSGLSAPAILHWLGPAFDPALAGYWGSDDLDAATETVLELISEHRRHVGGIKLSLLDSRREVELRRRLPEGVRMYTGDDHNYPELIRGDAAGHSDALLGIFDAIAPVLPPALEALERGEPERFEDLLAPTLPLARHLFCVPTRFYKTGLVWLAYLNGYQDRFAMLGGFEEARSPEHLLEALELARRAGLLADPEDAERRARRALRASRAPVSG